MPATDARHLNQSGFGLVEILIALALGVVIVLGITQLFTTGSRTMSDLEETGRRIENSVFAAEILADDLRMVGYWGEAATPIELQSPLIQPGELVQESTEFQEISAELPPHACIGTSLGSFYTTSLTDTSAKPFLELAYGMKYPILTGPGSDLNVELGYGGTDRCKAGGTAADAGSEFVALRRASTCALGDAGCEAVNSAMFYTQHQACDAGGLAGDFRLTDDQAELTYETLACDPNILAPIYKYISRIYYVNTADFLVRLDLTHDGTQLKYNAQRLVAGVELMRFEWGIDEDGDGTADVRTTNPSAQEFPGGGTAEQWRNIVDATIWLVVRSLDEVNQATTSKTTTFQIAGASYTPSDTNYARVVQTRTVEMVNISGVRR